MHKESPVVKSPPTTVIPSGPAVIKTDEADRNRPGYLICPDCGIKMIRLGSCFTCPLCGHGGCS